MPYINIDEREFGVGACRQIKENWDDFVDFTTNLLLFHRNSVYLDKFQIYAHDSSQQYVDRWIWLGISTALPCLRFKYLTMRMIFPSSCLT
jgi:hypothetical protein